MEYGIEIFERKYRRKQHHRKMGYIKYFILILYGLNPYMETI